MKIELGARVLTAEGDEIGTIDKLILDPEGGDLHAIVVRKGLLFGRDIEIPTAPRNCRRASRIGAAIQQKSPSNSSRSTATPLRRMPRSSASSSSRVVIVLGVKGRRPCAT